MSKKEKQNITGETLKFMLSVAWREKKSLYFAYVLEIISLFVPKMLEVILPKFLIDELTQIIGGAPVEEHLPRAVLFAGLTVGVGLLMSWCNTISMQLKSVISEWFTEYFDVQLAEHSMKMDFEHTENPEALDALNKAKEGLSWYSGGVTGVLDQLATIVRQAATLCGVVAIIIMTCPLLLPIQIIALVFITIYNAKNNAIDKESFLKLSKENRIFGYVFWDLADFKNGKDIRLYDSADMMCGKADEHSDRMVGIWRDTQRKQRRNSWKMDVVNSLRDGLSYFYIGWLALTGAISLGDFAMCISCASTLYWSLYYIVVASQEINKRSSYAHRYLEFLKYPAAMEKGTRAVKQGDHTIEFRNVSFKYPRSDNFTLRNVNITIRPEEHLSIVGLNGAGKTTFIKLLCRLYDVTEGEILVDGVNIKEYSDEEYRRLFAVVFQDFKLFAFSLRDNIALAAEAEDERINETLKLSGFYEDAQKLEHGLDTTLFKSYDEKGTELSGGQQQKTAISRALYKDAPVVILDEPTAALDPMAEYDIYRRFDTLVGGKTAIYISHRLSSCKFCDRIAVFAEDTIKEYGTHEELIKLKDGIYAEMFAAQAQYYTEAG